MNMSILRVAEGRLSEYYNHFDEYRFSSCQATRTRLMGVVALRITWNGIEDTHDRFIQILHLDYSEYGFDEYQEFECIRSSSDYTENIEAADRLWDNMIRAMGGTIVTIRPEVMLKLIELASPLAAEDIDREYDTRENADFRYYTGVRLALMKSVLEDLGVSSAKCSVREAVSAAAPLSIAPYEAVNYFLMRLVDRDYDAACFLSDISREELMRNELAAHGIQTLIRNRIREDSVDENGYGSYRCAVTTLGREGYLHSALTVGLCKGNSEVSFRISELEQGSIVLLSDYESALQVVRKEYITVFEVPDRILNDFDGDMIDALSGSTPSPAPNGWLFTIYNSDNSHVNSPDYDMEEDVYGYALLSIPGQLILMSHSLVSIASLETSVLSSVYSAAMKLSGRYLLERTPVFLTVCSEAGAVFQDLVSDPTEE